MNLTALDAYKTFQALKLHFTSESFDFHKYHGKTKIDPSSFMAKKDKLYYYKIAKKIKQEDFQEYVLANLIENENIWIKDLLEEDSEVAFQRYRKRIQSLSYVFEQDIIKAFTECRQRNIDASNLMVVNNGDHPYILKFYWTKVISLETLIILDMILDLVPIWNQNIKDTLIWPKTHKLMKKYRSFLNIDTKKYKKILTIAIKSATI
jgi:hypothetical protein